jgi:hypothetical protein
MKIVAASLALITATCLSSSALAVDVWNQDNTPYEIVVTTTFNLTSRYTLNASGSIDSLCDGTRCAVSIEGSSTEGGRDEKLIISNGKLEKRP